jgi:cytochrome c oxidase subunit 3
MDTGIQNKLKVKPYEALVEKRFSTYLLMMFFAIGSISVLFLALTVTYLFSKGLDGAQARLPIPPIFYVDTVILALGSFALVMAKAAFKNDNANGLKIWLYVALMAGVTFMIGQVLGWYVLSNMGFGVTQHRSGAFLLVISGIHAVHILVGIVFLTYIFLKASERLKDAALAVVYFSDPVPRSQLRMVNYYWHFLGVLWLYLLVFFAVVG